MGVHDVVQVPAPGLGAEGVAETGGLVAGLAGVVAGDRDGPHGVGDRVVVAGVRGALVAPAGQAVLAEEVLDAVGAGHLPVLGVVVTVAGGSGQVLDAGAVLVLHLPRTAGRLGLGGCVAGRLVRTGVDEFDGLAVEDEGGVGVLPAQVALAGVTVVLAGGVLALDVGLGDREAFADHGGLVVLPGRTAVHRGGVVGDRQVRGRAGRGRRDAQRVAPGEVTRAAAGLPCRGRGQRGGAVVAAAAGAVGRRRQQHRGAGLEGGGGDGARDGLRPGVVVRARHGALGAAGLLLRGGQRTCRELHQAQSGTEVAAVDVGEGGVVQGEAELVAVTGGVLGRGSRRVDGEQDTVDARLLRGRPGVDAERHLLGRTGRLLPGLRLALRRLGRRAGRLLSQGYAEPADGDVGLAGCRDLGGGLSGLGPGGALQPLTGLAGRRSGLVLRRLGRAGLEHTHLVDLRLGPVLQLLAGSLGLGQRGEVVARGDHDLRQEG